MRVVPRILPCFVMMFMATPAFADSITIEWQTVRGSRGYVVEYRRSASARISRKRVKANRVRLNLSPATYQVRVAGLNKFGKPGVWSDWLRVSVASSSKGVVRLGAAESVKKKPVPAAPSMALMAARSERSSSNTVAALVRPTAYKRKESLAARKAVIRQPNKKEKKAGDEQPETPSTYRGEFWSFSTLLAGLPQLQRGDNLAGVTYMGLAGVLTGFVINRGASADSIASQPGNNPILMSVLLSGQSQQNLFVARELRADARAEYDARVQDQRLAAGLLTLVYIWHLVDVAFWEPPTPLSAGLKPAHRSYDVNVFADGENKEGRRAEFRFSMRF